MTLLAEEQESIQARRETIAEGFIGLIFSAYLEPDMVKGCVPLPGAIRAQGKCVHARYIGTDRAPDYELVLAGTTGRRATITMNAHHARGYETEMEAKRDI